MYLEFKLPAGPGSGYALLQLQKLLHDWSDRYNIPYSSKLHKYTYRVSFDLDSQYTFFLASWNPVNEYYTPLVKDPMKVDRHR